MTNPPEPSDADPFLVARTDHDCFGCGHRNPIGLRLRFIADTDGVSASYLPASVHQGFDDIVHGGIISTVLDEAMAWATVHAGIWAVTADMRVRFRHPLNVSEPTVVTARVSGSRGRLVTTTAKLVRDRDGVQIATALATFVRVSPDVEAAWRARYFRGADDADAKSQP